MDRSRLRRWLTLFFLALAIPTLILIQRAYSQLKWEAFHQHRSLAEELTTRIDDRLSRLIEVEEARPFTDYAFLNVAGDPSAGFLQRSPLSNYPPVSALPGLIGYFQIDAEGRFSSPLLPEDGQRPVDYGITQQELVKRQSKVEHILDILGENRLVQGAKSEAADDQGGGEKLREAEAVQLAGPSPANSRAAGVAAERRQAKPTTEVPAQAAFDQLDDVPGVRAAKSKRSTSALGHVKDLALDYSYQEEATTRQSSTMAKEMPLVKQPRRERNILPEQQAGSTAGEMSMGKPIAVHIRTFESEIDPFALSLLESGHFVLFRKVWRDGQRYIQGLLLEQRPFLSGIVGDVFRESILAQMSELIPVFHEQVLMVFGGEPSLDYLSSTQGLQGTLLYKSRLSTPWNDLTLLFSIKRLPVGPGAVVIIWVAALLVLVLCGGFYLMYRLGLRQIELVRQQQDFVAAVSHELKTPLTSIRMYGEILREGWASEEKKRLYYDYIHDESERLSRLITNVLQLARMTRNDLQIELKPLSVSDLIEKSQAKIVSQIERAAFKLELDCDKEAGQAVIAIDVDAFIQILINLVDNAIKFSAKSEKKEIELGCHLQRNGTLVFRVRDYGPGVPREQMKKIFKLFYRSGNELTRETVGTGIGLALVRQLALAMQGQVDVVNKSPGAEVRLTFAALDRA